MKPYRQLMMFAGMGSGGSKPVLKLFPHSAIVRNMWVGNSVMDEDTGALIGDGVEIVLAPDGSTCVQRGIFPNTGPANVGFVGTSLSPEMNVEISFDIMFDGPNAGVPYDDVLIFTADFATKNGNDTLHVEMGSGNDTYIMASLNSLDQIRSDTFSTPVVEREWRNYRITIRSDVIGVVVTSPTINNSSVLYYDTKKYYESTLAPIQVHAWMQGYYIKNFTVQSWLM